MDGGVIESGRGCQNKVVGGGQNFGKSGRGGHFKKRGRGGQNFGKSGRGGQKFHPPPPRF